MKPKVFIARPVPPEVESYIAQHCRYSKWAHHDPISHEELVKELADAEGLLTAGGRVSADLLNHAPRLRAVSTMSVGYNNFDLDAMKARNIIGTNTPGVLDDTVADLIFALMLAAARRVTELDSYVKQGQWKKGEGDRLFGVDVHHKKLGIIGMGRIGEAVAKRARFGFGMEIMYYNRHRKPEAERKLEAEYRELKDLLRHSDFIVLMTPLTPETRHMIGQAEFALMKSTAVFVNASRGQTVDEEALTRALQERTIFAAGLDVFEREPVQPSNPLLSLPNVVTLPHIGSATKQTRDEMAMVAAENLVAALQGQTPPHVIPELRQDS
ncbi:bifunctional glyoxylate/hydroxypyruvate reductase B [Paenibacillus sp. CAA11]|uniref:2-hydroxyacid dehydrogenase n=1 Tax=Paenibacillus sp. CAA11 TaxID=1532905 RepID=UPI000D3A9A8E|nr:D-glycerate dehydrogenase [Paenibacillus sp. CAA11]AWB43863.1 bifunctional glyoxylate/hydroxypyruvate reductase B [Paenibacillus sp. CAA11]